MSENKAPRPPVPPRLDVRAYPRMPLDVVKLKNSDLWAIATPEEFRAAFALWMAAWHQVPAGSLPNDERLLAHMSEARADWKNVRNVALHKFELCSDGRLYHQTVCETAALTEAAVEKYRRAGKASAAKRKLGQQRTSDVGTSPPERSNDVTNDVTNDDATSLQQGEESRVEESKERKKSTARATNGSGSEKDHTTTTTPMAEAKRIGDRLCEIAQIRDYLGSYQTIRGWLDKGIPEQIILDTVAEVAGRDNYDADSIGGPAYFAKPIHRAWRERSNGAREPDDDTPSAGADETPGPKTWGVLVNEWVRSGHWPSDPDAARRYGSEPLTEGCRCPGELLGELLEEAGVDPAQLGDGEAVGAAP